MRRAPECVGEKGCSIAHMTASDMETYVAPSSRAHIGPEMRAPVKNEEARPPDELASSEPRTEIGRASIRGGSIGGPAAESAVKAEVS